MSQPVTLASLRERIRHIEQPVRHGILPFGIEAIDAALPGGGLALGAMHEIVAVAGDEEDAVTPAAFAAGMVARLAFSAGQRPAIGEGRSGGAILWCQKQPDLYGPGLAAHGLDPTRLVIVTARRDADLLWAIEETLNTGRAAGIAAVVGEIGRLPMVAGRRLQLAAERSGITAFLLRRWRNAAEAVAERERPTAAQTRWRLTALPSLKFGLPVSPFGEGRGASRDNSPAVSWASALAGKEITGSRLGKLVGRPRWRVELLRCRGGYTGSWEVEVADAAGTLYFSAGLADRPPAPPRCKTSGTKPIAQYARRRAG